ncbi:hypothetical protein [Chryseobacterium oryzae]|uniref:Uncharacterized protein n=1 Tax=Chryseobacterium oryzae TaxID=2929799 RepID=A0ABY4BG94_9FLAO|nr:hypothetical protein [Chryseobacterium oryzae]UOE37001.1 hypothetical protein MTP08_07945 [Chryseobacterium oryzae]
MENNKTKNRSCFFTLEFVNGWCKIAYNGKSIGEDGQKGIRRIQFCGVEANAFSWKLNYKKSWNEKQLAAKNIQIFNLDIQARFCQCDVSRSGN